VIVTGVDLDEFDWDELLSTFEEGLGVRCLPVMRPKGSGSSFSGVDIVNFSDELDGELAAMRDALIEAAVEVDEEAMTAYLEDDAPPSPEQTAKLLTRSMVEGSLVPVLCCSAVDGRGVPEVLKFITTYFPSPLDGPFFKDADENEIKPTEDGTVVYVFKTIIDPFVGQLCLLRIMRGEVSDAQHLQLSRTGKDEKISHLETIQGKQHQPSGSAVAGDIVAVAKMDHLVTEDTLCDPAHPIEVKPVRVPRAMVARAITLKDHADEVKLSTALKRAAAEDLTFAYDRSESTGQLVAHGVSLMHLEGVLKRMKDRYKVAVNLAVPRVAFQESSQIPAKGHHRHKKQTGGRGQFGEVYLSIEPGERGTGLDFRNATVGGSIPRNFIPAVEKGVIEVMQHGVIAGYPVKDVVVSVTDGKHHDVDSDEASFKLAGARAFKEAFIKSKPVLLEPVLEMQIAVPSRFMGAITSDITGRRGQITGMDALGDTQIVKANVPQKEVLTYSTALRSMTQGEGSYTAEFHDYEVMPPNVQQEVMAEFTPKGDED
jgi:elongation factor G